MKSGASMHQTVDRPDRLCDDKPRPKLDAEPSMPDQVIENPILNAPFDEPARHFRFDDDVTDEAEFLLHPDPLGCEGPGVI
jgi:hypothetical protein